MEMVAPPWTRRGVAVEEAEMAADMPLKAAPPAVVTAAAQEATGAEVDT